MKKAKKMAKPPVAVPSLLSVTVPLTSANILALATTPVVLIPAPGAGFYLDLDSFVFEYDFDTVAYAGTSSVYIAHDPAHPIVNIGGNILNNVVGVIAFGNVSYTMQGSPAYFERTAVENKPLVIGKYSQATGGDGTAMVTVRYSVRSF